MNKMTTIDKIKMCLFNPYILIVLFISTVVCAASGNRALLEYFPSLFILTIIYPILCKMAYMPLLDALGSAFFFLMIIWYMFS